MNHQDTIILLVAGSRSLDQPKHREIVFQELDRILTSMDPFNILPVVIVSGGARGIDEFAEEYATARGFGLQVFLADWNKHGKKAGFMRNLQMLHFCNHVVAFLNTHGQSNGTRHTIHESRRMGKNPIVIEL